MKIIIIFTFLLAGFAVFSFVLRLGGDEYLSGGVTLMVVVCLLVLQFRKNKKYGTRK